MQRVVWIARVLPVALVAAACGAGGGVPTTSPATVATTHSTPAVATTTTVTTSAVSTTAATTTSTTSVPATSTSAGPARVVPAEPLEGIPDELLPYPEVPLTPVTQEEIDAGLGDLVRSLALELESARPEWQLAYWGEVQDIEVLGRVAGILLFETHPAQEGICVHAYDGARARVLCGGTDGIWTRPLGVFSAGPGLAPEVAQAVARMGDFMLLVTFAAEPWVAVEAPEGRWAQRPQGAITAVPLAVAGATRTVRVFGPHPGPWEEPADWQLEVNGATDPAVVPDFVSAGSPSSLVSSEFLPSPRDTECLLPVPHGTLSCVGAAWRRVTFADPDVSLVLPIWWQAGVDATGIRISSLAEDASSAAAAEVCFLGGVPVLSADKGDVVVHVSLLEDAGDLPPRPENLSDPPEGMRQTVALPDCASRRLNARSLTFSDQGLGLRVVWLWGETFTYDPDLETVTTILDSLQVVAGG